MTEPRIRFYLFYGDDDFAIEHAVKDLEARIGDPASASMNITHFEAGAVSLNDIRQVSFSFPFLTDRRLVFVHHSERLPQGKEAVQEITTLLDDLPETTALVFLHMLDLSRQSSLERFLNRSAWIAWIDSHPNAGFAKQYIRPKGAQFARWIQQYAHSGAGEIEWEAAQLLADMIGEDSQLASLEMDKLLAYTNGERAITSDDVERLTPYHGQSDVFALVDAIGNRQGADASKHLHRMLEDRDSMFAFAMIARQFRLLTQIRESMELGLNPAEASGMAPFLVKRLTPQAKRFSLKELESIMRQLLDIDVASKTGRLSLDTALYELTAALTG